MSKKLRAYDNEVLADKFQVLGQMLDSINKLLETSGLTLDKLPDSQVPTQLLYEIAVTYSVMYDALVEQSLLSNAHHKPSYTTLH